MYQVQAVDGVGFGHGKEGGAKASVLWSQLDKEADQSWDGKYSSGPCIYLCSNKVRVLLVYWGNPLFF